MAGYLGSTPVPQATQHRESFTATSGQTTFATAGYTAGFVDVYLNGSHLSPADFTATNGSDVVLASGASADDVCDIISHSAFELNAQTFTGTTTMSTTDNSENLILKSTDADANVGPRLVLQRDSGSPADGDSTGKIEFTSDNDAGEATIFTTIRSEIDDASNGSEDGQVKFDMIVGGTQLTMLRFKKDEIVLNDDSRDTDFRVESDNATHALFVQGSDGNVGINNSGPNEKLHINGNIHLELGSNSPSNGATLGDIKFGARADNTVTAIIRAIAGDNTNGTDGHLTFFTADNTASAAATERMRIDSGGALNLGTTSNVYGGADRTGFNFFGQGGFNQSVNDTVVNFVNVENLSTTRAAFTFSADRSTKGSITVSSSATAYNTSSDYRLKTDAQPMTGASDRVLALKPVNFKWIADGSRVDGFLAHEAQAVVPECVTGTKDAMMDEKYEVSAAVLDDDGNETKSAVMGTRSVPDMQAIDQSKLVPLLVASLQEALARITVLENA